jgi:CRP-like cAMP-binding protein
MQTTAEKMLILRNVSIFSGLPDPALAQVADALTPVDVPAGTEIVAKGDQGSWMYIIAAGRVRVHDGELTLNELKTWDVFGEMAALDPRPRMASVTAITDTRLLRLDREPLYALMAGHVEIAQGIIHILAEYLRTRGRERAEDFAYMQQFARVTAAAAAVEAGTYAWDALDEVARRTDQLGQLARVFQRMIREVYAREERLKQEVQQLRIEIDQNKTARQVAEITETDYFKDLERKIARLRFDEDGGQS